MVEPACRRLKSCARRFRDAVRPVAARLVRSSRRSACSRAATAKRRRSSVPRRPPRSPRRRHRLRPRRRGSLRKWSRPPTRSTATTSARVVAEIADDRYMGRSPGSAGDKMTRAYLAKELARRGFAPGGEGGSWEQPVELVGVTAARAGEVDASSAAASTSRSTRDTDFVAASGVQARARVGRRTRRSCSSATASRRPSTTGTTSRASTCSGKVLLMLNNDPDWDPALFAGAERLYYGRWVYKYESAARHGAAGAIIIHTTPSAGYPWQVGAVVVERRRSSSCPPATSRARRSRRGSPRTRRGACSGPAADLDALVEQAKRRDFKPVPLGITTSLALRNTLTRTQSANVLGVLRGSDPELADEVVIYQRASRSPRRRRAERERQAGDTDLQRRARQRERRRHRARDRQGDRGAARAAAALDAADVRRGRGAGLARLGVLRQASDGAAREDRGRRQLRQREHLGRDARHHVHRPRQVDVARRGRDARSRLTSTARSRATSSPTAARTIAPISSTSRRSACRRSISSGGTDFVDQPPGWGAEQLDAYIERDYHQPSDELTREWNFDGIVQDAQFGFYAGLIVANDRRAADLERRQRVRSDAARGARAAGTDSRADSPRTDPLSGSAPV